MIASPATCYLLAGVFGSSGAWVLLDPASGLSRAMESVYGMDRVTAVKLSRFGTLVQFAIAILWVVEDRPVWARRLTLLFLLVGTGHILFLLTSDIKVACGCTAAPVGVSPRLIHALSLGKNAILAGMAAATVWMPFVLRSAAEGLGAEGVASS